MPRRIWVLLLAGLVTSVLAFGQATDTIWGINNNNTGNYSYAAAGGSLIGSGLEVSTVDDAIDGAVMGPATDYSLLGTTNGTNQVQYALLQFTSGVETGTTWNWGSGGTLKIYGCIENSTDTGCISGETTSTLLVSDSFSSVGIVNETCGVTTCQAAEFGDLQGTIDLAAAIYLGVSQTFVSPPSQMADTLAGLPLTNGSLFGGATGYTVTSEQNGTGDELNLYAPVPEGWSLTSSLGIFGFGLAVFGVARRFGLIKAVA